MSEMSLIYRRNRTGHITEPWGTPDVTNASSERNVLCTVMQEGCYPVSGLSVDAIIFQFIEQRFTWDMIKHFQEIEQNEGVPLKSVISSSP